jgi:tRNA (guanine37-N1)-methyltransferase
MTKMIIDILTGFPEIFSGLINSSIIKNALMIHAAELWVHNLRSYTTDKHGKIDDAPFGGGAGMVLMAQPIWSALDNLRCERTGEPELIYLSPQGETYCQATAREFSACPWLVLLCGHYKDVDGRVFERDAWREVSIGDYIVSGGEIPAAVLVDSVLRLLPDVLSDPESANSDSFEDGLLDAPYFTRPEVIDNLRVPEVLLSGNHQKISEWRQRQRATRTKLRRPDLWSRWAAQHTESEENKTKHRKPS